MPSCFSNLFEQTRTSPLARHIEKVSVDCGFWGPCCEIYKSLIFSCRSKHIHAKINQFRTGVSLWLVPLARGNHASSRQWWTDCWLMESQTSVATWYYKMNPASSLLKTARKMTAVDCLPIPWRCMLITDALVGWAQVLSGLLNSRRWHSLIRRLGSWKVLKNLFIRVWWPWWWECMGQLGVRSCSWSLWTSWYLALQTAADRNREKKESLWDVNHNEWKTNVKIHTGIWKCII